MKCLYCLKEYNEKYFYKVKNNGKTYLRKMCCFCILEKKKDYYKRRKGCNG